MATGTVKWPNDAKGFGVVTADYGGNDPFAHFSEMDAAGFKSLQENHEVSFDVKSRRTGKQAASTMPYRAFHAERPMSAGWSMSAATVGPMPVAWRAATCYRRTRCRSGCVTMVISAFDAPCK
jgi:CspA family cold shock protein